ncbi:MAG: SRPBCC domain-containing protein [Ginsengibacter sp.]
MKNEPFVIERTYKASVAKVLKAITDKDEMKQWYFDIPAFKPEVGFEFNFTAGDGKKSYLHLCKILEVIPGKKLSYSWRYDQHPGNSIVTIELFADGNNTRLKLTHTGLETFPQNDPSFAPESFAKGWNHIIGKSLPAFVETDVATDLH